MTAGPAISHVAHVQEVLHTLSKDFSDETVKRNALLMSRIGDSEHVKAMLAEVLNDRSLLAQIAGCSYRHINHFDKIVLVDNPVQDGYRLTLHLWHPPYTEAESSDELIHDHRFNFWSVILSGTMTSENFARSESGTTFRQYRYVPELRSRAFRDFYEFAGETKLAKTSIRCRSAGESYSLLAASIHRIALPQAGITCSLVLRGPRLRCFSTVFNTTYPRQSTAFQNSMFSPGELATRLAAMLDALETRPVVPGSLLIPPEDAVTHAQ